jgi:hypothetical protein
VALVTDPQEALDRLMRSPLWAEIHSVRNWALTHANSNKLELFLNPEDADGLSGCKLLGLPVFASDGVDVGKAVIFDRQSQQYIRNGVKPL